MLAKSHRRKKRNSFVGVPIIFRYRAHARMSCRGSSIVTAGRPLRVAYLGTSATMASLWMEKEIGGFAKEGLDVEVLSISPSLGAPALIANELDAVQMSASPALTATLQGHDAVFVAGLLNTMIWDFSAKPDIKSTEQLI